MALAASLRCRRRYRVVARRRGPRPRRGRAHESAQVCASLLVFVLLVGFFAWALMRDRAKSLALHRQTRAGIPARAIARGDECLCPADMKGQVWMLTCGVVVRVVPRRAPAAGGDRSPEVGPDRRPELQDKRDDGVQWLAKFGNPYVPVGLDFDGNVGIDFGVYGVPETFVIDKAGVIRHKQIAQSLRKPSKRRSCRSAGS